MKRVLTILSLFLFNPFKYVHRKNKFREVHNKDSVTKISSTKFAVFGPSKPEHLFHENFCPKDNRRLQPEWTPLQLYSNRFISYPE